MDILSQMSLLDGNGPSPICGKLAERRDDVQQKAKRDLAVECGKSYSALHTKIRSLRRNLSALRVEAREVKTQLEDLDQRARTAIFEISNCKDERSKSEREVDRYLDNVIEKLIVFGENIRLVPYYVDLNQIRAITQAARSSERSSSDQAERSSHKEA